MVHFRWPSLAAGVVTLLASAPGAAAQTSEMHGPELRTVGTATRGVRPDLATITIDFFATGKTPADAGSRVAARADSLRRAFEALGIPRDSLVAGQRWYWWRGRIETVLGQARWIPQPTGQAGPGHQEQDTTYRALDAIQIRIRNLSKVGAVIDVALAFGITQFSSITFAATNTTADQNEVLREAAVHARSQATVIAEASGVRLGRIFSLSTQGPAGRYEPYPLDGAITIRGESGGRGTDIVQPLVHVSATVYVTWELLPQR